MNKKQQSAGFLVGYGLLWIYSDIVERRRFALERN